MVSPLISRRAMLAAATAVALRGRPAWADAKRKLYVQPLGRRMPDDEVDMVMSALRAFYAVEVVALERVALPRAAFYPPRARYRAEKLLDFLGPRLPNDGHRILGITSVDISTTKGSHKDWGILGLANVAGSACVLSSHRCYRGTKNHHHGVERFGKVAVHEIGHTFGLAHCQSTPGCLMEDAHGTVQTCDTEYDLCARCRTTLIRRGYALSTAPAPWPDPQS